jgi:cytochrome P450
MVFPRSHAHLRITAAWLLIFLGNHPCWRSQITSELSELASSHSTSDSRQLTARLASVPLEVWEGNTPALDAAIRETLRLAQPHVAMRKNTSKRDVDLPDGTVIPPGAFAMYPFADVHLDPSLYPDPWTWDPARPKHPSQSLAYVGWGGG